MLDEILKTVTLLVATMAATWARGAKKESAQANDAVNHRHATGTPRLYDLALRNDERTDELIAWKRGYEQAGHLDTGEKVEAFMAEFRRLQSSCPDCPDCPHRPSEDDDATPTTD